MFIMIHDKEDKLQYFITNFIRSQANNVNLSCNFGIYLYVNTCNRNKNNGFRVNVSITDSLLKKLRHAYDVQTITQPCLKQNKKSLISDQKNDTPDKNINDMFSKVEKYLSCTHNFMFPKVLLFINASQDLAQHFSLLMLIFNHFTQLLDHVALTTFKGVILKKRHC